MPKPVALYYDVMKYREENLERLRRLFVVTTVTDPREDATELLAETEVLFAPLGFQVDRKKIARCPRLKVIISNTTGVPHIDMEAARERGIEVCALHDRPTFLQAITPTAEHTIGLMLAAWRNIPASFEAAKAGRWDRRPWGAPKMFSRMRLGIAGYGRLGRKVAAIARAMEMEVAFYDPYVPGGVDSMLELARRSEMLSLHAVANAETHHLASREVLKALPRGAMVVNTGRGELLDGGALLDLLESGHLHAAALDVIDGEFDPAFDFAQTRIARYAREHDNLLLTPHTAGSTHDAWRETERYVIERAARALDLTEEGR